jgi:hypothetical protein
MIGLLLQIIIAFFSILLTWVFAIFDVIISPIVPGYDAVFDVLGDYAHLFFSYASGYVQYIYDSTLIFPDVLIFILAYIVFHIYVQTVYRPFATGFEAYQKVKPH